MRNVDSGETMSTDVRVVHRLERRAGICRSEKYHSDDKVATLQPHKYRWNASDLIQDESHSRQDRRSRYQPKK